MSSKPTASAAFSETLQFITSVKLEELEKQRIAYQEHARVIESALSRGESSVERVELLAKAVRTWPGYGAGSSSSIVGGKLDLDNLDLWLAQARVDPNVSPTQLKAWGDVLEVHIRRISNSFDYAKLFGSLFTEWLSSGDEASTVKNADSEKDKEESNEDFTEVGRKEAHEQRTELEERIFEEHKIDVFALKAYLDELFGVGAENVDFRTKQKLEALENLRRDIKWFSKTLRESRITVDTLKQTISGLLKEDLLDNQKRVTLKEFARNDTILSEIASVLNMHIARIGTWSWPKEGVIIEMRRALNGKYRFYLQEEILLALFLHYIGVSWEVQMKRALRTFVSGVFKTESASTSRDETSRRAHFLSETPNQNTIAKSRLADAREQYFLTQMADSMNFAASYDNEDGPDNQTGAASMKQRLLDLMTTESLLARAFHGSQSILVSDLEWFGPSLPFDSILTVLEYFGVDDSWLHFFRRFLAIPLRFKDDPAGTEPRERLCGVPIGHRLSTLFGESILFIMDFAVNQRADGLILYRIFDDLQMWHHDSSRVVRAWKEMQRYAKLVGLKFNEKKTGSVTLGRGTHPEGLPRGDIRWGFLILDAEAGKWVVDQVQVEEQIVELRRQIAATRSIFGMVNAFNHYIRFIVRNLGGWPANCSGAAHLDAMISTISYIQQAVFPKEKGGLVERLRALLRERFEVEHVPLGWFFLPHALGCLGLHNPLVELLAIRKRITEDPSKQIENWISDEKTRFENIREAWHNSHDSSKESNPRWNEWTITLEEFESGREKYTSNWETWYRELLQYPSPYLVDSTPNLLAAIKVLDEWPNYSFSAYSDWDEIGFYDKWTLALYCDEIVRRFGSLAAVDPELIPVSMLELFRGAKIRWEQ